MRWAAIRDENFAIVSYNHVEVNKGEVFPVIQSTAIPHVMSYHCAALAVILATSTKLAHRSSYMKAGIRQRNLIRGSPYTH
jgi:hypothetical protein